MDSDNSENIGLIVAMGYSHEIARAALQANGNDVSAAVEWIESSKSINSDNNDGEFDLLRAAPPAPAVQAPTVFHPRVGGHDGIDHFAANVQQGSISEMLDARVATFTEMGFTHQQAVAALKMANDDVNEALTLLLNGEVDA